MPNPLVLIVEDDPMVARALERLAERAGFVVAVDPTGSSTLQLARELSPCCIVLDMGLPGADGRDVLVALKQCPETAPIPVVINSGKEDQLTRLCCLKLGARDYEVKPVNPVMFERLARQFLPANPA